MNAVIGQTLRRLGLMLEAVSVLGVVSIRQGKFDWWADRRIDPNSAMLGLFVAGIALWALGTEVMRRARRKQDSKTGRG